MKRSRLLRMRHILLFLFTFPAFITGFAQTVVPLQPHGPIPEYYRCPSHMTVAKQVEKRNAIGDKVSAEEEQFMREMNYYSQQRMLSGFVLFNDSMSSYVSRVAAEVLKDDPETFQKLHFYVYKSPTPNAFTSATGTILFTVGLLSQLENEAQLAYILCHEIVHFRQEHMLKGYMNREELNNTSTPGYLKQSSSLSFNQEQELEADRMGFEMFARTNYSKKEALRSFDVLEYSEFPFDDMPYDTLFFNQDHIKIPGGYYLKEVEPIYSDDNYDDKRSTHPNVRKRRMAMMTYLDTVQNPEGKSFIVSKNNFLQSRESCRYELCRLYLEVRAYPEAIYSSYMMLQKHPNDIYFRKIIGQALYNLAAYDQGSEGRGLFDMGYLFNPSSYGGKYSSLKRAGYYRKPAHKDYPGQQQQIFHLFNEMEADELTILALVYNWKIHKEIPGDSLQAKLCDNLFYMLVNKQNLHLSYFSTITPDEASVKLRQDSLQRVEETGETGDSKFSRLDKFKLSSEKERFTKFAFVELFRDTVFVAKFKYHSDHHNSLISTPDLSAFEEKTKKEKQALAAEEKKSGFEINRVLIISPDYEVYRQKQRRKEPDQDFTGSEQGQSGMTSLLKTEAIKAGVEAIVLNPLSMDSLTGDSMADLAALNEWFFEKRQHGSHAFATNVNNQAQADSIMKKYNTRYVMFTAVEASYYKRIQRPFWFGVSCLAVIPAVRAFIPRQNCVYDVAILDLKTGDVIHVSHEVVKRKKENESTHAFYYSLFEKIKKPAKEKANSGGGKPDTEEKRGM
ncbi:MAG TPA: M48 family metallopeptidase [Bacteroidia bacterium]|nr:M48 family metallopeptidase [Bacteroidia bacterium]